MGAPRRFAIPNDCLGCTLRQTCDFCNLPQPLMTEFNAMGHLTLYPANATLLTEGQIPRGVYIACSGRSKLSVEARDGKTIILENCRRPPGAGAKHGGLRGPVADYGYDHRALPDQVHRTRQLPASDQTPQPRRARMRSHARPRGHELVRRCLRAAARPQFDGEARTSAAFLGLGRGPATGNFS
jgi:CRP-like cAMP-binding protein